MFHNGEEMTAADVVASFNRWAPVSSLGQAISPSFEAIAEVDPYTVTDHAHESAGGACRA